MEGYVILDKDKIPHDCWNIESIEAHKGKKLSVTYIGSVYKDEKKRDSLYDYYQAEDGSYWYDDRQYVDGKWIRGMDIVFPPKKRQTRREYITWVRNAN